MPRASAQRPSVVGWDRGAKHVPKLHGKRIRCRLCATVKELTFDVLHVDNLRTATHVQLLSGHQESTTDSVLVVPSATMEC